MLTGPQTEVLAGAGADVVGGRLTLSLCVIRPLNPTARPLPCRRAQGFKKIAGVARRAAENDRGPITRDSDGASSWLRGGLNLRPLGYEPDELPDCSTCGRRSGVRTQCSLHASQWRSEHQRTKRMPPPTSSRSTVLITAGQPYCSHHVASEA